MSLLITAFEPFDGDTINSSLEAMRAAMPYLPQVRFAVLPVEYDMDVEASRTAIAEFEPKVVLHLGQSRGETIQIERIAINLKRASRGGPLVPIDPYGPAALFSTMDSQALAEHLAGLGLPVVESAHAGTYMCNHILYRTLQDAADSGLISGFMHLPRLPEQAKDAGPSLPLETLRDAVIAAGQWLYRERDFLQM